MMDLVNCLYFKPVFSGHSFVVLLITMVFISHTVQGFAVYRTDFSPFYDNSLMPDEDMALTSWDTDRVIRSEHEINKREW